MTNLQHAWHYFISEPFTWIFYVFFQPDRFTREVEARYPGIGRRVMPMLKLIVPIFLLDCLIGLPLALMLGILFFPPHFFSHHISFFISRIEISIIVCFAFGILCGIIYSIAASIGSGIAAGIPGGIVVSILLTYPANHAIASIVIISLIVLLIAISFAYFFVYFRMLLYLATGQSTFRAYIASRRDPSNVFDHLHRCSLYWEQGTTLPLPFLKEMLLMAYDESPEQTMRELEYIMVKRSEQLRVAREALLEIVVRDLERCHTLEQIADSGELLTKLLLLDTNAIDARWSRPIVCLRDASSDALRTIMLSPIDFAGRHRALGDVLADLRKEYPVGVFRDQRMNSRLTRIMERWQEIARQERERLGNPEPEGILDPYQPGKQLSLRDSLFQGRRDLAGQLENALNLGVHRPTFFLNSEQRMGKSSVLQQLPVLLGAQYISVIYDLQRSGLFESTAAFLSELAYGIVREMNSRGMQIKSPAYDALSEVSLVSDAAAFSYFKQWFVGLETTLRREQRTLLLAFDEFEALEESQNAQCFDVRLLLGWLRDVIRFHPRVALLFSGVKTLGEMGVEMGIDWTGYFMDVRTLRVSFLHADEARRLIRNPTPDFPGADIFNDEVIEKIMVESSCHPFLVQALCSSLITVLNVDRREQATLADVRLAVGRVLEEWDGYFRNQWNRTDEEQKACLAALLERDADVVWLAQRTNLDERAVRRTLQRLTMRDLVSQEPDETYRIAVPMMRRWLENTL